MGCLPFHVVAAVAVMAEILRGHLRVRGYWGPFYRTQTWRRSRADDESAAGAGRRATESRP
jgi:hypothetical protein